MFICPTLPILLNIINLIKLLDNYTNYKASVCSFLYHSVTSTLLGPSTVFSNTQSMFFPQNRIKYWSWEFNSYKVVQTIHYIGADVISTWLYTKCRIFSHHRLLWDTSLCWIRFERGGISSTYAAPRVKEDRRWKVSAYGHLHKIDSSKQSERI